VATVTSKGQITLPKRVREALGLGPGAEVEFEIAEGAAIMRKRLSPATLRRWRGFLRQSSGSTSSDELVEQLREP
jgi:antitoxin PrlF